MQINQTNIDAAYVKQDTTQASGTTVNNAVDDASKTEDGTAPETTPSTIVMLGTSALETPSTYEFGNGPGKPPP
jgi:hypothetical protein